MNTTAQTTKAPPELLEQPHAEAAAVGATVLKPSDTFVRRHIGPNVDEIKEMLDAIGADSLEDLVDQTIPESIRMKAPLNLGEPRGETETLNELRAIAAKNKVLRSCIGMGYYDTITPPVIQRNILENPGWYTQYTPYQPEISQGRLEALINFQTMVADLTGLPLANASLLDEATAAAEAMNVCVEAHEKKRKVFLADAAAHPQTIAVMQTRAEPLGIELRVVACGAMQAALGADVAGVLLQYPATDGAVYDQRALVAAARAAGAKVVMAADLLALTLLVPPGELGADVAVGTT